MWTDILLMMRVEMWLTAMIILLLFTRLSGSFINNNAVISIVNAGLLLLLISGFFIKNGGQAFGDMFYQNDLLRLQKNMMILGTLLVSLQAHTWISAHKHAMEFYLLLLTSLLGLCFMLSSGNLLMFYVGLEMSTIPLAALANFDLHRKRSSEAAFKMIVSSAFASGMLLFGISWIYGSTGSISFSAIPQLLTGSSMQVFALVWIMAGFGFKISMVPFHLWTADVYEGSPMPVTAFLSVMSKGAVVFAFVSVLYKVFSPMQGIWYNMLYILAILTMLIGNLFALRQQNIKRFLAFSSVTQIGFILVGISGSSGTSVASVIFFVLVYLFSNLAAFGVVSAVSYATGKEAISDYKGFRKSNPALAWALAIALFSLAGIPPMAGFFGKFFLLLAGAAKNNWWLIIIAALNMIIAMAYYMRIVKFMFMDDNPKPMSLVTVHQLPKLAIGICIAGILLTGVMSGAYQYIVELIGMHA